MRYQVYFINQKKEITVNGGTVADACEKAGFSLNLVCGGNGTCGKCAIFIKKEEAQEREKVLACQTYIEEDTEIYLNPSDYRQKAIILTKAAPLELQLNPSITKKYITKEEIIAKLKKDGTFFSKAILPETISSTTVSSQSMESQPVEFQAVPSQDRDATNINVPLPVMQKFSMLNADKKVSGCTFISFNENVIAVEEDDTTAYCYGAAADIGTTTVALYIYDMNRGNLIATKSALNKQTIYGADVIARNASVRDNPAMLHKMRKAIVDTINEMLAEAAKEHPKLKEHLYHIVLCGNSTMQQLFYGINPYYLGISPFATIIKEEIITGGKETNLLYSENAIVEFLPLLGGFVGADTTSVLLTLTNEKKKYLMIDLGTNGELAVGSFPDFLVASTACGPALEGGNIACGMRGTSGAIEKVSLENNRLTYKVIGDAEAIGLCGSAIIDAVAELRRVGLIDETGTLLAPDEYRRINPFSPLIKHLHEAEEYNMAFYFIEGSEANPPVYLSQKDIRQIQLAKSSIYSGCIALLEESGITLEQVDALILAGAFGNYVDTNNALSIGLLPNIPREKIISIGNGAGQGVQTLLLDKSYRSRAKQISQNCTHLSLAENKKFMEEYIKNMNL